MAQPEAAAAGNAIYMNEKCFRRGWAISCPSVGEEDTKAVPRNFKGSFFVLYVHVNLKKLRGGVRAWDKWTYNSEAGRHSG